MQLKISGGRPPAQGRSDIRDEVFEWDGDLLANVGAMIGHAITNAVDHGYVRPRQRGKVVNDWITFSVACARTATGTELRVADRGAGFDIEAIRKTVASRGLIAVQASDTEVLQTLFADGVTTAETVTERSGRGVGLAAIRALAEQAGGRARLEQEKDGGAAGILTRLSSPRKQGKSSPRVMLNNSEKPGISSVV